MIGQVISTYRVVRRIGEGSMGEVFEAIDDRIGRRVAIKVLRSEWSNDRDAAYRFLNEARPGNVVRHPGIVEIYEFGQHSDGTLYLVMEYLAGESLQARMRRRAGRLELEGVQIGRQIAAAMANAHRCGIIHRDLKPGNVMIVPDPEWPGGERVKVLDFGLAKLAATLFQADQVHTKPNMVMGTPTYMAPEQCGGGGTVSDRSDVYALGTMLYLMLADELPLAAHNGESLPALLWAKQQVEPRPLDEVAPWVAPELRGLIHAMLAINPAARPSMSETAATLDRVLHQATERVPHVSMEELDLSCQIDISEASLADAHALAHERTLLRPVMMQARTIAQPHPRRGLRSIVRMTVPALALVLAVGGSWMRSTDVPASTLGAVPVVAPPTAAPRIGSVPQAPAPAEVTIAPSNAAQRERSLARRIEEIERHLADGAIDDAKTALGSARFELCALRGEQALKDERWADAEVLLREATQLNPRSAGTLLQWAQALHKIGRYRAAAQVCQRALRLQPQLVAAHQLLASAAAKQVELPPLRVALNEGR